MVWLGIVGILVLPLRFNVLAEFNATAEMAEEATELPRILSAMNQRIEAFFDREHILDLAYFMIGDSLASVFRTWVIPLPNEYLFEDWSKVRMALAGDHTDGQTAKYVVARRANSNC